ncbi:lysine N(6)-hydroxylase/L-ornithine N(5)-oxygenase family protein [Bacillus cereus]|uniref:lysine N(6)-hydroxylase/L-ornithine N(5)-oxygenase family protein n=1 Tax=Bacillus cereus TaxID=1396 RepID=UPI000BED1D5F|nr:SidA/IucD/PvdA family monooxygenase [Bacillus cereus]PEF62588.1 monooxygenase [Bacillus cereus]
MYRQKVYDVIGIGLGPSNLALAIAIHEHQEDMEALFFEKKEHFDWHPNMMIPGSDLQVSFLKDLVTTRNPSSSFTFLNYLKQKQRLHEFINLREFYPSRREFADYYSWIAGQLETYIRYHYEVMNIEAIPYDGVNILKIETKNNRTGEIQKYLTKNLVVATGGIPTVPPGIQVEEGRVFHSHEFMHTIKTYYPNTHHTYRFLIVGSGQSAAEIFSYLGTEYPNATVTSTMRKYNFQPIDDSAFTNQLYYPEAIDFFYQLPLHKKEQLQHSYQHTNYAVVDADLIHHIYHMMYAEKVNGSERLRILGNMTLQQVTHHTEGFLQASFQHMLEDKQVVLETDAIILATGYRKSKYPALFRHIKDYFVVDTAGNYQVERDYQIRTNDKLQANIYLQGMCEDTHGFSDPNLSNLPQRSFDILQSILGSTVCSVPTSHIL